MEIKRERDREVMGRWSGKHRERERGTLRDMTINREKHDQRRMSRIRQRTKRKEGEGAGFAV